VQERDALLHLTSMRRDTGYGDLSKFGRIDRSSGLQFGPSSVFSKRGDERKSARVTRVSSSSNMFAMLDSSGAAPGAEYVGSRITALARPPG
jgi:hypothetical protein